MGDFEAGIARIEEATKNQGKVLDSLDGKMTTLLTTVAKHGEQLKATHEDISKLDSKIDKINGRVRKVESFQDGLKAKVAMLSAAVGGAFSIGVAWLKGRVGQ